MKFKNLLTLLNKDKYTTLEIFFESWESGSIECEIDIKYDYLLEKLGDMEVKGIAVSLDDLQVVLL